MELKKQMSDGSVADDLEWCPEEEQIKNARNDERIKTCEEIEQRLFIPSLWKTDGKDERHFTMPEITERQWDKIKYRD